MGAPWTCNANGHVIGHEVVDAIVEAVTSTVLGDVALVEKSSPSHTPYFTNVYSVTKMHLD